MKPFTTRLLDLALSILAAALMLSWAWSILRPLVPVVVGGVVGVAICLSLLKLLRR